MSAHAEKGVPRQVLLARLQKQIQEQGGSAFLALSASSHPVLCVGAGDCRTSVVVVEDNEAIADLIKENRPAVG